MPPAGGAQPSLAPCFIVHDVAEMIAALTAASRRHRPVRLRSAPGAAAVLGAEVFAVMARTAMQAVPVADATFVLDCGDAPGHALAALRAGVRHVRVDLPEPARTRIRSLAERYGGAIDDSGGPALDLAGLSNAVVETEKWLSRA